MWRKVRSFRLSKLNLLCCFDHHITFNSASCPLTLSELPIDHGEDVSSWDSLSEWWLFFFANSIGTCAAVYHAFQHTQGWAEAWWRDISIKVEVEIHWLLLLIEVCVVSQFCCCCYTIVDCVDWCDRLVLEIIFLASFFYFYLPI